MDHIRYGKSLKHFKHPPPLPSDKEIETFGDGLKETVPLKLKELLKRLDQFKKQRNEKLKIVRQKMQEDSIEKWFLTLYFEHEFSEAYIIQKWLSYWLSIWQKISKDQLPLKIQKGIGKIDDLEKEKANQRSLKDLYEGQLQKSGSRLTGLCPFHEEKTHSFFIFADNHYHCYGCGAHGDAISFVMKLKGLTFPEAVRYLL